MLAYSFSSTFPMRVVYSAGFAVLAWWMLTYSGFNVIDGLMAPAVVFNEMIWWKWPANNWFVAAKFSAAIGLCAFVGVKFFRYIATSKLAVGFFVVILMIIDYEFAYKFVLGMGFISGLFAWIEGEPPFEIVIYEKEPVAVFSYGDLSDPESEYKDCNTFNGWGFNPATGLPIYSTGIDTAGNLFGTGELPLENRFP